jgi:hypothetical protein
MSSNQQDPVEEIAEERREPEECTERAIPQVSPSPTFSPNLSFPGSTEMLRVCGWCSRVLVGGVWMEIEEACAVLKRYEKALPAVQTHGICDTCYEKIKRPLSGP